MEEDDKIVWFDELDSTNRYAADNFDGLSDGSLVVASSQTAGKGRHQRNWVSPPDQNVYASFVVKNFRRSPHMASLIGSLGVLDTLELEAPGLEAWLKWPNDVYCGERKIAGLLCESVCRGGVPVGVIIGIGLNVNMPGEALAAIDQPATSVFNETGRKLILKKVIKTLAKCLCARYSIGSICMEELFSEWKRRNFVLGRQVEIVTDRDGQLIRGKVIDFGSDGQLIVESGDGVCELFSGDVRIDKASLFNGRQGL